ncbi:MAG: alpha/beta hydrolase [Pirellulales bacterium]
MSISLEVRIAGALLVFAAGATAGTALAAEPTPSLANYRYGPHERNVLDLWMAKSQRPAPLLAFFHGGGFDSGDKKMIDPGLIRRMADSGISVMAVNYRLTPQAKYPEHYLDCARAIQTARVNHEVWNVDPERVAATGPSAGGVISLWLAFHVDLADAKSADPVLRESTRLRCAAVIDTPASLDPRDMRKWIGERAIEHRFFRGAFFGLTPEQVNTPAGLKRFVEASPLSYLTADDPPVYAFHHGPKEVPTDISVTDAVHHYNSGVHLKERMDQLKLECVLVNIHDVKDGDGGPAAFVERRLAN